MKRNPFNTLLFSPDPAPSGGGNAPAAPTAPNAGPPAQKDGPADIASFDPGPVPNLSDVLSDPPPPAQAPAQSQPAGRPVDDAPPPGDPTNEDPFAFLPDTPPKQDQPTQTQDAPPPSDQPVQPGDNKGLRGELERANARIRELESGEDRKKDLARLADLEQSNQRLQGQIHARDPLSHPEVVALRQEMAGKYAGVVRAMSINGEDAGFLKGWLESNLPELVRLGDPNGDAYLKKVGELRKGLHEQGVSRESIGAILNLADQGVDNTMRTHAKVKDINDNWTTYEAKHARDEHEGISKQWAEVKRGWFSPTPDQLENDPYNPVVFLTKAMESDGNLKKQLEQTGDSLIATLMPLAPVMPTDLDGKSEEEISAYLEDRVRNHLGKMDGLRRIIGPAMAFYRMGPGILRRLQESEAALADYKGGNPIPSDTRIPAGTEPSAAPAGADAIKSYEPGPLPVI